MVSRPKTNGTPADPTRRSGRDAWISDLRGRVTDDFSQHVRAHVDLAKVEIKDEVARAGKGAGMLTGGAIAALFAAMMLSLALAWGLAEVMDAGWAFLIVGLVWTAAAAVLAYVGRNELKAVQIGRAHV